MITKITLKNFGKFKGKSFEFSPVTVFIGKNEAGKTTIYDALFQSLSNVTGTTREGKRLNNRYGPDKERQVSLEPHELQNSIDADEYQNVYAIRAGDSSVNFKNSKTWLEKLKNAIFADGVDPANLAVEFEQSASSKGSLKHIKEKKELEKLLQKKKAFLLEKQQKRSDILNAESNLKKSQQELRSFESDISSKKERLSEINTILSQQALIARQHESKELLVSIGEVGSLESRLKEMKAFENDDSAFAEALHSEISELEKAQEGMRVQIETKEKLLVEEEKAEKELLQEIEQNQDADYRSERLVEEIRERRPRGGLTISTVFNTPILVSGIILFIAGILSVLNLLPVPDLPARLAGIICILLGLLVSFLSRRRVESQTSNVAEEENLLKIIKDKWAQASRITSTVESLDGLENELRLYHQKYQASKERRKETLQKIENYREQLKGFQGQQKLQVDSLQKARDSLKAWYQKYRVQSMKEYSAAVADYKHMKQAHEQLVEKLKHKMAEYNENSFQALKVVLETGINDLKQRITEKTRAEVEINRLNVEKKNLEETLSNYENEYRNNLERVSESTGGIKAAMADLPGEIFELEKEAFNIEKKIEQLNIDMKAAAVAAGIFKEISRDHSSVFTELGREVSELYNDLFPENRTIEISDFSESGINIQDAGGTTREIEYVSTATKDAFQFTARLAFAVKTRGDETGFVILDEPFASFDEERNASVFRLLKKFFDDYKWQVIIFTKDKMAERVAYETFNQKELKIHSL